jgi:NADH-quinone oxidoreductase chain G
MGSTPIKDKFIKYALLFINFFIMLKIFINNQSIFVNKTISVLEACELNGINLPRFCFHERLNIAGNCRMCLVEIEKAPKPIASCAFPITANMRIYTNSPLLQKARENILEFLLLNHPLDCPICDQAGECDLQEQTLIFGSDRGRFFFLKRAVEDKNCGVLIKTIMTRCIHCTRCVRFFKTICGEEDFGTTLRGSATEIGSYITKNLTSELSGNIIDLCPVGALTSKPYTFLARAWELKTIETIDITDSIGANIKINFKETEMLRILPVLNDSLNDEWITDKTRFFFDTLKNNRIGHPFLKIKHKFLKVTWKIALDKNIKILQKLLKYKTEQILIICGNIADLETIQSVIKISKNYGIKLITEDFLNINTSLMYSLKMNTTFTNILKADVCLFIGTNPRFETSLLNVRIKKRYSMGNFFCASFGLSENLTYSNETFGNSLNTLLLLVEGKHSFCKKLVKAKTPMLIVGSAIKKRLDSFTVDSFIFCLNKFVRLIDENWIGLNFLAITANKVGSLLLGQNSKNKLNLKKIKLIYLLGLNSVESPFIKLTTKNIFIVNQSAFFTSDIKKSNLILPSTAFTEKTNSFINLEGRFQKTKIVLQGPSLARDDLKIILSLFPQTFLDFSILSSNNFLIFTENKKTFIKQIIKIKSKATGKIFKTSIKTIIPNFFETNIFTNNSLILAKCASIFRKNYKNFL